MNQIEAAWSRWCANDPELAVVCEFEDLRQWTKRAPTKAREAFFARIIALTVTDSDAVSALMWLMLPAAIAIAKHLRDRCPDIDELVAGQLWIECRDAHRRTPGGIPAKIRGRLNRAICTDLGVGEGGHRRDRVWKERDQFTDPSDELVSVAEVDGEDPVGPLDHLLTCALRDKVFDPSDADLLRKLAVASFELDAPAHRGRGGLTATDVVKVVGEAYASANRTLRRHAVDALNLLESYAPVKDDPVQLAAWKEAHPLIPLTTLEELALFDRQEELSKLVNGPERLSPDEAWARIGPAPWRRWRS